MALGTGANVTKVSGSVLVKFTPGTNLTKVSGNVLVKFTTPFPGVNVTKISGSVLVRPSSSTGVSVSKLSGSTLLKSLPTGNPCGGGIKHYDMMTQQSALQTSLSVQYGQLVIDVPTPGIREPLIMLRWSDDGGHTWSNEYVKGVGMAGEYSKRIEWRRLGKARDRVYEVAVSDPVVWRIIDAYLFASPDYEAMERYAKQMAKMA